MKHDPILSGKRKAVNLSLDTGIVETLRTHGLNLSKISEEALHRAAKNAEDAKWQEENRAWIDAHRAWVEANELPLERYRMF